MEKLIDAVHWLAVKSARPWTDLRAVSNSSAARATIFVPLIGYLIIFNDNLVHFLDLARELGGSPVHGVSSRLLWIYFGLCSVSVGAVLYGFACPPEVKHYGTANAYIAGDGDSMKSAVMTAIQERLEKSDFGRRLFNLRAGDALSGGEDPTETKNALLHMYFDYMNTRHRRTRIATTWAYLVGFSCLAVPSIEVFARVLSLMVRRMFT
jgi:hypothetical protein